MQKLGLVVVLVAVVAFALVVMSDNAASAASSIAVGASSAASSMTIGQSVQAVSNASMVSSAAISAANFNVTVALCLGGLMTVVGLLGGAGLAYFLLRKRMAKASEQSTVAPAVPPQYVVWPPNTAGLPGWPYYQLPPGTQPVQAQQQLPAPAKAPRRRRRQPANTMEIISRLMD
jgi:hypothetical protein